MREISNNITTHHVRPCLDFVFGLVFSFGFLSTCCYAREESVGNAIRVLQIRWFFWQTLPKRGQIYWVSGDVFGSREIARMPSENQIPVRIFRFLFARKWAFQRFPSSRFSASAEIAKIVRSMMSIEFGRRPMLGGNEGSFGDELEKEISLLLREQRRQDADDLEKELNLFRSGSAPPTVEGSLSAVGSLFGNHGGVGGGDGGASSGPANNRTGNGFRSDEELRSDPAYLSYYYSNVNLNPRLPHPSVSKEDWRFAQRLQGGVEQMDMEQTRVTYMREHAQIKKQKYGENHLKYFRQAFLLPPKS